MSSVKMYCVRDVKVGGFNNPFCFVNDAVAVRSFEALVNEPSQESMISKYPGDYDLYCVGIFDQDTGLMSSMQPEHVISAAALVKTPGDPSSSRMGPQA